MIQRFAYHLDERVLYTTARPMTDAREVIRAWLRAAGDAAAHVWIDQTTPDAIRSTPTRPTIPTFVVLDRYEPDADTDAALLRAIATTPPTVTFVVITESEPPVTFTHLVADGTVRLVSVSDDA